MIWNCFSNAKTNIDRLVATTFQKKIEKLGFRILIIHDTYGNFITKFKQKIVIWPLHLPLTVEKL